MYCERSTVRGLAIRLAFDTVPGTRQVEQWNVEFSHPAGLLEVLPACWVKRAKTWPWPRPKAIEPGSQGAEEGNELVLTALRHLIEIVEPDLAHGSRFGVVAGS